MRVLILGASGFIGQHLVQSILAQGWEALPYCRSGIVLGFSGKVTVWKLGEPLDLTRLGLIDCAIHLAHDFEGEMGAMRTINATCETVAALRDHGVQQQLYFSSYSAGAHANSLYGRTKSIVESRLRGATDVAIIRPGLVVGNGGIYGRISYWAERLAVIPLPEGGVGKVPVIAIERLCQITVLALGSNINDKELNAFELELKTLRQIVLEAAAAKNKRPIIIAVPVWLMKIAFNVATWAKIPLPISLDNLTGFLSNQGAEHVSSLKD